ncbi:MAG: nucleotidyltransferase family protein [Solobacterium sp.]|nr:nucleotidyltransferase family protein [Solobacterium sp.]
MKTCGIIAEYNPFHNGHRYHIEKTRELTGCEAVIAVMSGNFVQRGEPAVKDKFSRAETAVRNGADVVLELPCIFAVQGASAFAHGAVSVLRSAGIDQLSFGSECGNLENLLEISETPVRPENIRELMDTGMSYPKAYSLLTRSMLPNDILAVSYLKEIRDTGIEPVVIQRTNDYSSEILAEVSSAAAVRKALREGRDVSGSVPASDLSDPVFMDAYYPYLRNFILTADSSYLRSLFLCTEGIENHLKKCAAASDTWDDFMRSAVTYRYTASRIRRTCVFFLMQLRRECVEALGEPRHMRVLAFSETGRRWLQTMRESEIRPAMRFAAVPKEYREIEYRAALAYASVLDADKRKKLLQREIEGASYVR